MWSVVSRHILALCKDIFLSPSYLGPYFTWSQLYDCFAIWIFAASFPSAFWLGSSFLLKKILFLAKPQARICLVSGCNFFPFFFFLSFFLFSLVWVGRRKRRYYFGPQSIAQVSHYKANQSHKTSWQHPRLFYWKPINNRGGHGKPISPQSIQVSFYNSVFRG